MKTLRTEKKLQPYRMLLGLGIGLSSMMFAMPANASVPSEGCSAVPAPATQNLSTVQVSKELEFLRRIDFHGNLGFDNSRLLIATCSGTCNADGSGSYTQEPGCTYTQTCGGGGKKTLLG
jgi:hypothetical protein